MPATNTMAYLSALDFTSIFDPKTRTFTMPCCGAVIKEDEPVCDSPSWMNDLTMTTHRGNTALASTRWSDARYPHKIENETHALHEVHTTSATLYCRHCQRKLKLGGKVTLRRETDASH